MALLDEIREYVNKSHANAWRRAGGKVPDEPGLVSSFLSKEMYRGLRRSLQSYVTPSTSVMVRGIFTHQTPKVRLLHRKRSVEIADLMFVHQHFATSRRAPTSGRALLFQAKRTGTTWTGSVASGTQATQFELYRDWAAFEGTVRLPSSPVGDPHWDFREGGKITQATAVAAAEYMTVFDQHAYSMAAANPQWTAPILNGPAHSTLARSFPASCAWSAGSAPLPGSIPSRGVTCSVDFGTVLTDFLRGARGRPFNPGVLAGSDHWSVFVNRMLSISARPNGNYLYTSKNQNVTAGLRGRNVMFLQNVPALWHAVEEEVERFLAGEAEFDMPHFAVTNSLLARISESRGETSDNLPPDNLSEEPFEPSTGGHVPMLLIVSVGDDDSPVFRPGENG
ncbi:hypothetical protein K788_0001366 (plasmid) [Paraburkholderia caribensis MBA4]|uniref:Uncharacterized protein n=1 Tax=Paraburkholderia caribensis MBA4 TaxID=1323664 RepID=A0A0P0RN62_9BURK|nr:hypothetical protein K788_0001366 [Paraburkholderia caribensis MBA4]